MPFRYESPAAEVIIIGDELVSGQIIDTNSVFIAQQLLAIGVRVRWKTCVGDDPEEIVKVIQIALQRADYIIATGGLGPTPDDVTKKAVLKVFKRPLVLNEEVLKTVQERFQSRGLVMPKVNQNQALLPQGSKIIPNPNGSAVGIYLEENGKGFIALPGVPAELKPMVLNSVLPLLQKHQAQEYLLVRTLRTTGIPESELYERLADEINRNNKVKFGFLPGFLGIDIRLTTEAKIKEQGEQQIDTIVRRIKPIIQRFVYAEGDESLESVVGSLMTERKMTLAIAESCTGGMIAARLTNIPGSSNYFERGVVTYSNESKIEILGVSRELIDSHGAVCPRVARAMAEGVRKLAKTSLGIGVTGIAGPTGGTPAKPVGLTYIGLASEAGTWHRKFLFNQARDLNRQQAAQAALDMLRLYLLYGEVQ